MILEHANSCQNVLNSQKVEKCYLKFSFLIFWYPFVVLKHDRRQFIVSANQFFARMCKRNLEEHFTHALFVITVNVWILVKSVHTMTCPKINHSEILNIWPFSSKDDKINHSPRIAWCVDGSSAADYARTYPPIIYRICCFSCLYKKRIKQF